MEHRIAVMRVGRVEQLGSPEELYDRPATQFVAGFIGTSNLLAGTIEAKEPGAVVVRLDGGERCVAAGGVAVGTAVDLAIGWPEVPVNLLRAKDQHTAAIGQPQTRPIRTTARAEGQ